MKIKNHEPYEKLLVWQKADDLTVAIYLATQQFPSEEKFGLTSQIRRSCSSVPLNIVEGQARGSKKDYLRFLLIARGSLAESAYLLQLGCRLRYIRPMQYVELEKQRKECSYLLQRLISSLKS